ncbi:GNAT family N-acetyltransferase [Paenibacillus silviterrae]|uniref:GNAT family N-acetyltransferase n=1 Tax=Paenibacillus silviterrae TaxID=3242194 RepID=UPI00254381F1|nr:GNAT family N-acetyltransferase [Paenibacillus chinjuensis]
MSYTIRNAAPSDIPRITELMHEYIVGFYKNPWPSDEKIHLLIQTLLEKQVGIQFVVEQDTQLIGFATIYFTFSTMRAGKITIMNDFFVLEPYRNTEIEASLFLHCKTYSQDQGFAYMSWITAAQNERAQQFFAQMGSLQGNWINYSIS